MRLFWLLISHLVLCIQSQELSGGLTLIDNVERAGQPIQVQLCGYQAVTNPSMFIRVVGGKEAKPDKHQWLVSIQVKERRGWRHFCGATLVATHWVLTANHCMRAFNIRNIRIVAGDHNLKKHEGTEQVRFPESIFSHKDYNDITQENDIALIKLSSGFVMHKRSVAPICLPQHLHNFSGNCVVAGWGKTKAGGSDSKFARMSLVPIITDAECRKRFTSQGFNYKVTESMLCAGSKTGGKDACQGDSGGPFVCVGEGNLPVIAGIVSWGVGCGSSVVPGVYTEVSRYTNWIHQTITKYSNFSPVNPRPISRPFLREPILGSSVDRISLSGDKRKESGQQKTPSAINLNQTKWPVQLPPMIGFSWVGSDEDYDLSMEEDFHSLEESYEDYFDEWF